MDEHNELQSFARSCQEQLYDESSWLHEFNVEWIDSDGHAKFLLKGPKATATVEWNTKVGFKINVVGADLVYYETSRSVLTAAEALSRVSSLLCVLPGAA